MPSESCYSVVRLTFKCIGISNMADLFGNPVEIHTPRRYEIAGKVHGNRIAKVNCIEAIQKISLIPYSSRRVTGFAGDLPDGRSVVFLPKRTTSKLEGQDLALVPECASLEDLSERSRRGAMDWLRPKPQSAKEMSINEARAVCQRVRDSWRGKFRFQEELRDDMEVVRSGLRPPQIGALHAALAHWSVSTKPATIVMPTGTGKTETMLALLTAVEVERLMVVVPNAALRDQIAEKFMTLGILKAAGVLDESAELPVVATLERRPTSAEEVDEIFERANVIVTTMQVAGQCNENIQERMAEHCSHLYIDEAHHIAARTWQEFKGKFESRTVVQFTATPFRTDGKKVDGRFIYVYPLAKAQGEGYFRPIQFQAVQGLDEAKADAEIIRLVGNQLRSDLNDGHDHLVMARANNIDRAIKLHRMYDVRLSEFNPVVVHSRMNASARAEALAKLRSRDSRIIVCVDMLGEGFDLPQLKISGLHDRHKSVAITLQFTGRFTRDSGNIGDATVIANIEQSDIDDTLRTLYAEDADWNYLLKVLSEAMTGRQLKRAEVLDGFTESLEGIPLQTLYPKMSTVVYRTNCEEWRPQNIDEAIPFASIHSGPVINDAERLAVFITRDESYVRWSSTKEVVDVEWNLYLVHWEQEGNLLYINSSKTKDLHDKLAKAVCGDEASRIVGENVYRVLDGINRLMLMNLGLSSTLGRNIRYTMFVGSDITTQLDDAAFRTKRKSNLFGIGYRGEGKVLVGCSAKGKIWSTQSAGDFSEWLEWCHLVGSKLVDESIATDSFIRNLVKQELITKRPDKPPISVHWPESLLIEFEDRIQIKFGDEEWVGFYECDIDIAEHSDTGPIRLTVSTEGASATFEVQLSENGVTYPQVDGLEARIDFKGDRSLSHFFSDDPPHIYFADGDFLIFNELFKLPRGVDRVLFDLDKVETRDWSGTDLNVESQGVEKNPASIQRVVIEELLARNPPPDIVFDDDGSGEIADVVAVREHDGRLTVELFHCKYAHGAAAGNRVADLYEVCGQAQKSVRWREYPVRVLKRMRKRENDRIAADQPSRFERGDPDTLKGLISRWRELEPDYRVWIVQPGVSKGTIEPKQVDLLAATEGFLLETYGIPLRVITSE